MNSARYLLWVALLGCSLPAIAGRNCETRVQSVEKVAKAFDAADHLRKWLDRSQANVVLVARRGQNLEQYGVTFSHLGYVVREREGGWAVYHSLNKCRSDQANLFIQGLAEFFADDLFSSEVAAVVPSPPLQERLYALLHDNDARYALFEPRYSVVAYPFATHYANSDTWVVELFAQALSERQFEGRQQAVALLKVLDYEPSVLEIGALKRLGGRLFAANVAFDDHPSSERWSGRIHAHTGDSLLRFAARYAVPMPDCDRRNFGENVCILPGPVQP